jgi:ABC-type amino acid transport substrate-binding protein
MRVAVLLSAFLFAASRCDLPRDPHRTLDHVRNHVLTVGVSEDPPYIIRKGDEAVGREADIIRDYAAGLGARVEWQWGSQERHFEALQKFHLDVVAGGVSPKTPWKKSAAVTRPFLHGQALAVPAGENGFLLNLERHLAKVEQ